jgi:hypothetical protein
MVLPITMDSPDSLLDIHWVPRQVKVKQNAGELKVDSSFKLNITTSPTRNLVFRRKRMTSTES